MCRWVSSAYFRRLRPSAAATGAMRNLHSDKHHERKGIQICRPQSTDSRSATLRHWWHLARVLGFGLGRRVPDRPCIGRPGPYRRDLARAISRTVPCYLMRGWQAIDHAPACEALSVGFSGSFFRPCRGWALGPCGPRAGARGYILSPLTGLVYDRLRQPFSSRRGLGQAFLRRRGGSTRPGTSAPIHSSAP
jgi:hypothetical protein